MTNGRPESTGIRGRADTLEGVGRSGNPHDERLVVQRIDSGDGDGRRWTWQLVGRGERIVMQGRRYRTRWAANRAGVRARAIRRNLKDAAKGADAKDEEG